MTVNGIAFKSLMAIVLLCPLPFGSDRPWSWSLLSSAIAVLLLIWGIAAATGRAQVAVPLRRIWSFVVPFLGVVVWAAAQSTDLTPAGWHHTAWQYTEEATGLPAASAVSINPFDTLTASMRLLAYGGVFWLALQLCRDRERARQAVYLIVVAGVVYAVYGIVNQSFGSEKVLWFDKPLNKGVLTSTFVIRNTYATYAGIGLLCATAFFFVRIVLEVEKASVPQSVRSIALNLLIGQTRYFMVAIVSMCIALVLTGSRAGILATGLGLVVLLGCLFAARMARRRLLLTAFLICVGLGIYVLSISGDLFLQRLDAIGIEGRSDIFALTADAISDSPMVGTGYGTYAEVFHVYQDERVPLFYTRAHSTYLENAMEIGVPAAAILVMSVAGLGVLCLAGALRRRRDAVYPCSHEQIAIAVDQSLPFEDEEFDLIVSDSTFEHIEHPETVSTELLRVLKRGGYICARTPNAMGYVKIFAQLIPNSIHAKFLKYIQPERMKEDIFPTVYKMNTVSSIKNLFPNCAVYFYRDSAEPAYFFGSRMIYRMMLVFHKIVPEFFETTLCVFIRKSNFSEPSIPG